MVGPGQFVGQEQEPQCQAGAAPNQHGGVPVRRRWAVHPANNKKQQADKAPDGNQVIPAGRKTISQPGHENLKICGPWQVGRTKLLFDPEQDCRQVRGGPMCCGQYGTRGGGPNAPQEKTASPRPQKQQGWN